ncbi:MAG TPA: hypothetical protein VNJ46_02050 [Gaiellaceae bacterium]|nr:hypothetical protein [Gaiellaceae bacterium]
MRAIELRALRPTHPLGYLAALGLHRTLVRELGFDARLAWTDAGTPHAVVEAPLSREELVSSLASVWQRQATQGAVKLLAVHGQVRAFPPHAPLAPASERAGERGMNDPAKMLPSEYASYAEAARASGDPEARAWIRAVASDVVLERERRPPIATLTQFYLLSRGQRLAQQFEALWTWSGQNDVRVALHQAVSGWRRVEIGGGMNWDIDANQNAAETPRGKARTLIVPGATWLAMMALPYFPVRRSNGRAATRGFQLVRGRPVLVLPTWRTRLDLAAIEALLDHPALELEPAGVQLRRSQQELDQLGITSVHKVDVVARRMANQTECYLGKCTLVPPAPRARTARARVGVTG